MRRSLLNKRILPKPLRQALVLITLLLLPSAAWGITKQYYLYGKDNNKVIGTTSDGSSTSYWTVSGSYDSFDASSDNNAGFTSIRTSNGSLTLTSEGNFYKIKSVTVDIGAGDWGSGQETSSFVISVNGVSPSNTSYSIDHQYTGSASNISTDFKVVTFTNPADSEEPVTIEVTVSGIVDVRIQSITVEYTENYGLTIGETALTSDNVGSDGTITDLTGVEGTLKFTPADEDTPATLTLKGATINGDIQMESSADNKALIINLDGENEITGGMISFSNSQYPGDLTFTGTGSLNIGGEEAIFYGVNSVNTSNGLYIATDFPNPYCQNGFYLSHLSSDNNEVTSATISTSVTYPIWVYKGDFSTGTGFTQVTDANKSNILGDDDVKLSYNNNILTLNGFTANTYYTGDKYTYFMTYIGNELDNLTVNLASVSEIEGKGFYFEKENATLSFTTGETPGKLTISDYDYVVDSYQNTTVKYEKGLGNYFGEISVDWPRLKIGETLITGSNPVEGYEGVSYDDENNILTLDGTTIGTSGGSTVTDIFVYIKDLTVEISGSNTLYGRFWGQYEENDTKGTIFFKKASDAPENTSLIISGIVGGQGPITDFSKCTWDEDLYLTEAKNGTESLKGVYYNGSTFIDVTDSKVPDYVLISDQPASVSLWIGDTPVKTDNASNVFAGNTNLDGKVSVTFGDTNILTLDNADIQNYIIVSALPNLTIEFKSGCYWDKIISTNSNATLTFSLAEGAGGDEHDYLCCMPENSGMPWEGFSAAPTFNNNLCYLPNSDSQYITKLRTPQFNMSDGKLIIEKSGENLDQIHAFYSVDFVEGNDVGLKEYNSDNPQAIDKPCTVTAYTEFEDVFGVKRHSDTVTGKYFGIADKTIVFNNETKPLTVNDLEIIPATEDEGISFSFRGVDNSDVIMPSQEGNGYKLSIAGIGRCEVSMEIDDDNATIQVLNPFEGSVTEVKYAKGVVIVLPDKPSIVKDTEHEYIETDKITITRTSVEGEVAENIKIFYTWAETEPEVGSDYTHGTTNPTLTIYENMPIPAQTGTLWAWVGYSLGDNEYLMSETDSKKFEVKNDIALCTVTLPENATYGGTAFVPVVEAPNGTTATTPKEGTDYTVSYQKVEGETATEVESMIDAGTYKITITGIGNYGGTSEVENFQISQASLEDAAISKLIVGDKEYEYDPDKDIEIPYTGEAIQPEVVVLFNDGTVTVDPSEYTVSYGNNTEVSNETAIASVTVTSTNKNFTGGTSTSLEFKIVPALVTITAAAQTVTYNAEQQAYTGASVNNENAALVISYYTSEEERTTGSNALAGAPTDAGTYYVSVTLNAKSLQHYTAEPANVTFTIAQLDISDAVITLDYEELTYNGKEQSVTVEKVMVGDIEVAADYYEVSGNSGTEVDNYTVTVTAKTKNSEGSDFKNNFKGTATAKFNIVNRSVTLEELGLNGSQPSCTYYSNSEDLEVPDGIVAYIITGINGNSVTTQRVSYIPKGVAVYVEKTTSSEEPSDEISNTDQLPLKGTQEAKDVTSITGGTVYVLYNGEFVKSTSGTIPAHRCYLLVATNVASGTRSFGIDHGDGTTSLREVKGEKWADGEWYTLQGRKFTTKPTKPGLYILNGKKVVIK